MQKELKLLVKQTIADIKKYNSQLISTDALCSIIEYRINKFSDYRATKEEISIVLKDLNEQ